MGGRLGVAGLCLDQVRGRKGACDWAVVGGRGVVGLGGKKSVFGGPVFVGVCVLRAAVCCACACACA